MADGSGDALSRLAYLPQRNPLAEALAAFLRPLFETPVATGEGFYTGEPAAPLGASIGRAVGMLPDPVRAGITRMATDPNLQFTDLARIGVLPGRERLASEVIKRGLKEPWFHGTPRSPELLRGLAYSGGGFNPESIGTQAGLRLGEPAGVSVTRSPEVAAKFGDVLRVGVDVPPSSVGQFVDPEVQRMLRAGYAKAGELPMSPTGIPPLYNVGGGPPVPVSTIREYLRAGLEPSSLGSDVSSRFNQAMSDYLRQQGLEALLYSPRRFAEFELRVLDPERAVPLGRMPLQHWDFSGPVTPEKVARRYWFGRQFSPYPPGGKSLQLEALYQMAPDFPVRLRDVLGVGAN